MTASKTYTAQKALNTCLDQEHVEVEMYCRTCKKPVCTKCVKGEHHGHDRNTMIAIAKELRNQTIQRKLLTESVSKSILIGTEKFLNSLASTADNELEFSCSALEKKRKSIVDFVNKSIDEMKSKCQKSHKAKMKPIDEGRKRMKSLGERIKFLTQNMEIGARDYTDSDLIELHDEINRILNELQALSDLPKDIQRRNVYRSGTSDMTSLESLLGTVESGQSAPPEATFENEFKVSDTCINTIHLVSEREAWIHPTQTTINNLVDSSGTTKQTVDLEIRVYNFTVSDNGDMYFCDIFTKTVREIDKEGNACSLFSTSPLIPKYITLTRSGDLLITLVYEDSDRNSSSRRLVRRTSMSGEVMKEYEYDNDGKTQLFCMPLKLVEHQNGDICVINEYKDNSDNFRGTVYGLHCNENVMFRYESDDEDFHPFDICCDNKGNILISDWFKRVHLINCKGYFVRFLLSEESFNENLYAMDLFGSTLWIGSRKTGLVKVFKFKN